MPHSLPTDSPVPPHPRLSAFACFAASVATAAALLGVVGVLAERDGRHYSVRIPGPHGIATCTEACTCRKRAIYRMEQAIINDHLYSI